jgi:hypothetical protein
MTWNGMIDIGNSDKREKKEVKKVNMVDTFSLQE